MATHTYTSEISWTGNSGTGTCSYQSYLRDHDMQARSKAVIKMSSDPAFFGDVNRYNPEELFIASLSSCHMLWYLHLCADNGIVVTGYEDNAVGIMEENENGGRFTEVILKPKVTVAEQTMTKEAMDLHRQANEKCFIANSCNFLVKHQPECNIEIK